jgi:uncharacterized membrane protein YfcA
MLSGADLVLTGFAAVAAGAVNALAGGGTLITFPTLLAIGVPPIAANVTNTVALCPGYLGATLAQLKDLRGQKRRLSLFLCAGVIGGLIGGSLLLNTGEKVFRTLVPFLILLASALLAAQGPIRAWLASYSGRPNSRPVPDAWAALPVGLAAIYGGYFGAGLSVIVLAVLGLMIDDSLTRLNATKQIVAFSVNTAAAVFFLFSGRIVWPAALVMALGASLGGALGGRLASRIKSDVLRWVVVAIGIAIAAIYLVR